MSHKEFEHKGRKVSINRMKKQYAHGGHAKSNYDYWILIDGDGALVKSSYGSLDRAEKEAVRYIDSIIRKAELEAEMENNEEEIFIEEEYDFDSEF